jgi:hypothetical protein
MLDGESFMPVCLGSNNFNMTEPDIAIARKTAFCALLSSG